MLKFDGTDPLPADVKRHNARAGKNIYKNVIGLVAVLVVPAIVAEANPTVRNHRLHDAGFGSRNHLAEACSKITQSPSSFKNDVTSRSDWENAPDR